MRSYRHAFTRIDPRAVEATRRLLAAKPWRGNPGRGGQVERTAARRAFDEWLREMSEIYGIRCPALVLSPFVDCGGEYIPVLNVIAIPKFSVFTLAHEFRHAWQFHKRRKMGDEEDARGWSVSLVYAADEKFYRNAVKKGLVLYA